MKKPKIYRAMPKAAKKFFIRYGMVAAIMALGMVLTFIDFKDDPAARVCFFLCLFFFVLSILMLCIFYDSLYSIIKFDNGAIESKAFKRTRRR